MRPPKRKNAIALPTLVVALGQDALRVQVREFLSGLGFLVLEAGSPCDGWRIAAGRDVRLAIMDDPAHIVKVAATRPTPKLLLISGDPDYINREALSDPAIAFIEKPFAWCDLKRKVFGLIADGIRCPSSASGAA